MLKISLLKRIQLYRWMKALFQPYPLEVLFQSYEPFGAYELKVNVNYLYSLRNPYGLKVKEVFDENKKVSVN